MLVAHVSRHRLRVRVVVGVSERASVLLRLWEEKASPVPSYVTRTHLEPDDDEQAYWMQLADGVLRDALPEIIAVVERAEQRLSAKEQLAALASKLSGEAG